MKKATQRRTVLTVGEKITRVNIIDGGNAVEIFSISESDSETKSENIQPQASSKQFEEMFPVVEIENVSVEDSFMQYKPKTMLERRVKASIVEAKRIGMKNFRKPAMDPSFDDDGETIIYCAGRGPAVGKSAIWWDKKALKFMPEKNSRMINNLEKNVCLGILIKDLVEEKGYEVKEAWKAVCYDSKKIGHYFDSKDAKPNFEPTGSRQIGKWFDLGNVCKIVQKCDERGYELFGGVYNGDGEDCPLADAVYIGKPFEDLDDSVGEIVMDM